MTHNQELKRKEIPLGGAKTYKGIYLLAKTIREDAPVFVIWVDAELKWFVHDLSGYFTDNSLYHFQFPENDIDLNFDYSKCEQFVKTNEVKGYADRKNISKAYMGTTNIISERYTNSYSSICGEDGKLKDEFLIKSLSQKDNDLFHELVSPLDEKYTCLWNVLKQAFDQASSGKGQERHGNGKYFRDQPMFSIANMLGSNHFMIGQAVKKAQESTRMDKDRAIKELLGSIVYMAGAVIYLENQGE